MRFVSLALFFAAACYAQTADYQASPRILADKLKEALRSGRLNIVSHSDVTQLALTARKTCSIPLLNAMPRNAPDIDKPMILPSTPDPASFPIRLVTPPAPPCKWGGPPGLPSSP